MTTTTKYLSGACKLRVVLLKRRAPSSAKGIRYFVRTKPFIRTLSYITFHTIPFAKVWRLAFQSQIIPYTPFGNSKVEKVLFARTRRYRSTCTQIDSIGGNGKKPAGEIFLQIPRVRRIPGVEATE